MSDNLPKNSHILPQKLNISSISTGFIEVPGQIALNLYVQGCKMRCEGCQNADLQPFEGGKAITLENMELVLKHRSLPTWICWLGGDAVYQPEAFLEFNAFFKQRNYQICLYTGKSFSDVENLLENVDLVIDGAWEGKTVDKEDTNQGVYLKEHNKWNKITFSELKSVLNGVD